MKPGNAGRAKEPQSQGTQEATKTEGLAMSLSTPESVQKLQTALHDKAKGAQGCRRGGLSAKLQVLIVTWRLPAERRLTEGATKRSIFRKRSAKLLLFACSCASRNGSSCFIIESIDIVM
jgi:hypothetical protein